MFSFTKSLFLEKLLQYILALMKMLISKFNFMIDIYYLKNRRSIKSNQESNNFDFLSLYRKENKEEAHR